MKKIKYILLFTIALVLFNSCESVVNTKDVFDIKDGNNFVTFSSSKQTNTQIAESGEYPVFVKLKLDGPTTGAVDGDLKVTVTVDEAASTAIEGTHYRIDHAVAVLKKSDNYLGEFEFTQLTAGIQTPLAELPVLVLKLASVDASGKVIASGKPMKVTLSYACPSDLGGLYNAHMVYVGYDGSVATKDFTDLITETGIGQYRTTEVGHWIGGLGVGTPGYTFFDVCGDITIPGQYLVDYYGNWVQGTATGSVSDAGVIHVEYSICYPQGSDHCRTYVVDYTPAD